MFIRLYLGFSGSLSANQCLANDGWIDLRHQFPANTKRPANVGTMLAHRLRRWPNSVQPLTERFLFAGLTAPLPTSMLLQRLQ